MIDRIKFFISSIFGAIIIIVMLAIVLWVLFHFAVFIGVIILLGFVAAVLAAIATLFNQ